VKSPFTHEGGISPQQKQGMIRAEGRGMIRAEGRQRVELIAREQVFPFIRNEISIYALKSWVCPLIAPREQSAIEVDFF
jgi:hypothetical protein